MDGWGLLLLWTLGSGLENSGFQGASFVPSPDAIWSFICVSSIGMYLIYLRHKSDQVARGIGSAATSVTLPVYRALLLHAATGLGVLSAFSIGVMFAANFRFSGTPVLLGALNFVRWFTYELVVETVGLFFTQRTLGRRALLRAIIPAGIWAALYSSVNVCLFAVYYDTVNPIQRFVIAGVNFAIAAIYGGPLALNFGRPALRPYAWFTVIQRCIVGCGLILSVFHPPQFPVIVYDFTMMIVQVNCVCVGCVVRCV